MNKQLDGTHGGPQIHKCAKLGFVNHRGGGGAWRRYIKEGQDCYKMLQRDQIKVSPKCVPRKGWTLAASWQEAKGVPSTSVNKHARTMWKDR